jgi:tetratricopeptide (TPR) repeat protein
MKLVIKFLLVLVFMSNFVACNETEVKQAEQPMVDLSAMTFMERVVYHIENNEFDEAFSLLKTADQSDPTVHELLLATHMSYALEMTYGSLTDQRTRMPEALRHYRRVLELDPTNSQAQAEIVQIEGIYRSLNREIPEGVAD